MQSPISLNEYIITKHQITLTNTTDWNCMRKNSAGEKAKTKSEIGLYGSRFGEMVHVFLLIQFRSNNLPFSFHFLSSLVCHFLSILSYLGLLTGANERKGILASNVTFSHLTHATFVPKTDPRCNYCCPNACVCVFPSFSAIWFCIFGETVLPSSVSDCDCCDVTAHAET